MFSEPLLIQLSARPGYLLIAFTGFLLLFDLVLVRWLKLSNTAWKRVEYIWLSAAAAGLLMASAQAGRYIGTNHAANTEDALRHAYGAVRDAVQTGVDGIVCRTFRPSTLPDQYVAEVEREHSALCAEYKRLLPLLPEQITLPPPDLRVLGIWDLKGDERIVGPYIRFLIARVEWYESIRQDYVRWREAVAEGSFEVGFRVLGPLLVAFALALRITKVTGEIANEKRQT